MKIDSSGTSIDLGSIIERIVSLYQESLSRTGQARRFLDSLGLNDAEILRRYRVGYADGSLARIASAKTPAGKALRSLGYVTDRGKELFAGCVVFPLTDPAGAVVGMYGRRVEGRQGAPRDLYLPGPHRGVWNREGAKAAATSGEAVILCRGVIEAMSCVAAGVVGAIALDGSGGLTEEVVDLLRELRPSRVTLLLGEEEATRAAARISSLGLPLSVARPPEEKATPEALKSAVAQARPVEAAAVSSLPVAAPDSPTLTESGSDLLFAASGRVYRIKNFNPLGFSRLRATILLSDDSDRLHVDTMDLYSNKARSQFVEAAATRLGLSPEAVDGDLMGLVLALDRFREEATRKMRGETRAEDHVVTTEDRAMGMEFLASPDLVSRIASDCEALGYIGEERNKVLAYLVATSRKMREPLSAVFLASSGAGKSALMEAVEALMPSEEVYAVSDLTPQALFYMSPDELSHKLLIVAERAGSEDADYSLRELQTKRVLRKGVAVKDPETGRIRTVRVEVRGPVAVMESTTSAHLNPENANRCFVLDVDETKAQTERIQELQRRRKTPEGVTADERAEGAIRRHHAAQRLLESVRVVIPYAERIRFPADSVRTRRDHARFLNLIEAVAFLHQFQRERREVGGVEYIEATLDDYNLARRLAGEVLAANLDELPRSARLLLSSIETLAAKKEGATFTRRDLAASTGWSYGQVRSALGALEETECVAFERGSRGQAVYRLVASPEAMRVELPDLA